MRNPPHTEHSTMIGILRQHVIAWRKANGWSRETVVQQIVDAHELIEGPAATGIVFDPPTRDTFERQRVNADRVFRWLDDESKDNNLLPVNFLPSIWAAMPMDIRLHCIADCLSPIGVSVSSISHGNEMEFDTHTHMAALVKESAEAHLALLRIGPNATLSVLEAAEKEVADVHEATSRTRRALNAVIAAMKARAGKLRFRKAHA